MKREPDDPARAYSVKEVAAKLGVNPKTVYSAIEAGELPAIRIGQRLLLPRAATDRLLDEGRQPPASP